MILYRCFPWDAAAGAEEPGGALWFARPYQGAGRHDAPERYGCLYVTEEPVSAIVEELARFVGTRLAPSDLVRGRLPLALAALELAEGARVVDLDQPLVLAAAGLRPSVVATWDRKRSQADAEALYELHADAVGLRWWSTFDPRWRNVTLFDRALEHLDVLDIAEVGLRHVVVGEAAAFLGLRTAAAAPALRSAST